MSIIRWVYMPISQTRGLRPNSSAVSLPTPINSAAGRTAKLVSKLLILLVSWVLEGLFLGATTRFLHEAGIVRGEKDDALGDVGHRPHAADRKPGQCLSARLVDVVGAEIACPHDEHLIAHLGLGRAGVDRVDANSIAFAREFK